MMFGRNFLVTPDTELTLMASGELAFMYKTGVKTKVTIIVEDA